MNAELDEAEAALRERAAAAASEAELRQLWTVWRRLTLTRIRDRRGAPAAPPWAQPAGGS